ncbi:MAG: DUF2490 domain-containing protein [Pseudomonadota bacterium]
MDKRTCKRSNSSRRYGGHPAALSTRKALWALCVLAPCVQAEPGLWLATDYNYAINDQFSLRGDNQWRSWNLEKSDFNTLLLRNSLVYKQVGFGYAFLNRGDFGESDETRTEHRLFQDFYLGRNRFRSEQRWVDGNYSTRYRWKINAQYKDWYGYNELFITPNGFNQNRTKIGYHFTEHVSAACQYIHTDTRDTQQLALTWTF